MATINFLPRHVRGFVGSTLIARVFMWALTLCCVFVSNAQAQWLTTGNALTADGILGTNPGSNFGIRFRTNGLERLRLSNTGDLTLFTGSFLVNTTTQGGRFSLRQGWGNWINFQTTLSPVTSWSFHNPPSQDEFIFGHTNSSGTTSWSLRFHPSGKISMGIDDPSKWYNIPGYRLYVKDGILTERVKVALVSTSQWADYVFEPDYALMPLEEVRAFIAENCHLPGVPSAAELVDTGLDVVESDAVLLKKIEELTLYLLKIEAELSVMRKMVEEIDR